MVLAMRDGAGWRRAQSIVIAGGLAAALLVGTSVPSSVADEAVRVVPVDAEPIDITFGPPPYFRPWYLNSAGEVVLYDVNGGTAAIWSDETGFRLLDIYGQEVRDINEAGEFVGYGPDAPFGPLVPIAGSFDGPTKVLLDRGAFGLGLAAGVANDGTIVGTLSEPGSAAAVWTGPNHDLRLLDDLGYGGGVMDLNEVGEAVGWVGDAEGRVRPATWDLATGTVRDLSPLVGFADLEYASNRHAIINNAGQVILRLTSAPEIGHADVFVDLDTDRVVDLPRGVAQLTLNDAGQTIRWLEDSEVDVEAPLVLLEPLTGRTVTVVADSGYPSGLALNDRGHVIWFRDDSGLLGWSEASGLLQFDVPGSLIPEFDGLTQQDVVTGYRVGTFPTQTVDHWIGTLPFPAAPPPASASSSTSTPTSADPVAMVPASVATPRFTG